MAALWHTAEIAPFIFTFTFAIALGHAVLLGLPLFGFAVGALPDGVLTWPMQHFVLYTSASVDGGPTMPERIITAAEWISYIKPVIYCGSLGALGGLVFWVIVLWSGSSGKAVALDR
jgi:hypothetical protein